MLDSMVLLTTKVLENKPPEGALVAKDIWLLIGGAVLGLLLALFVQPLLDDAAKRWLVGLFGTNRIRKASSLAGIWHYRWGVDQGLMTSGTTTLFQIGNNLTGKFSYEHKDRQSDYRLLAVRVTEGWISGRYEDVVSGHTFHGVFQLHVEVGDKTMQGRWMGFDSKGNLLEGPWLFDRVPVPNQDADTDGITTLHLS